LQQKVPHFRDEGKIAKRHFPYAVVRIILYWAVSLFDRQYIYNNKQYCRPDLCGCTKK